MKTILHLLCLVYLVHGDTQFLASSVFLFPPDCSTTTVSTSTTTPTTTTTEPTTTEKSTSHTSSSTPSTSTTATSEASTTQSTTDKPTSTSSTPTSTTSEIIMTFGPGTTIEEFSAAVRSIMTMSPSDAPSSSTPTTASTTTSSPPPSESTSHPTSITIESITSIEEFTTAVRSVTGPFPTDAPSTSTETPSSSTSSPEPSSAPSSTTSTPSPTSSSSSPPSSSTPSTPTSTPKVETTTPTESHLSSTSHEPTQECRTYTHRKSVCGEEEIRNTCDKNIPKPDPQTYKANNNLIFCNIAPNISMIRIKQDKDGYENIMNYAVIGSVLKTGNEGTLWTMKHARQLDIWLIPIGDKFWLSNASRLCEEALGNCPTFGFDEMTYFHYWGCYDGSQGSNVGEAWARGKLADMKKGI